MTAMDHLANNDPLRAMDVLPQRVKAIDLAHEQLNWNQAVHLELVKTNESSFRLPAGGEGGSTGGEGGLVSSGPRGPGWWNDWWITTPLQGTSAREKDGKAEDPPQTTTTN